MAAGSRREQILARIASTLEAMDSIAFVQRKRPSLEDLKNIASTQFPFVAITAGLPKPDPHTSPRYKGAKNDKFISGLEVEVICYALDNTSPDTTVSSLADDLWATVYSNQLWNGLAIGTEVMPDTVSGVFHPYIAFKMKVLVHYIHGLGGI